MPPRRMETTGETSSSAASSKRQSSSSSRRDMISSLPDTILHHILSFLDMKHVVQTSILSKRWKDLWASLRKLTFDTNLFYSISKYEFHKFVDQVFILRDNYSDIDTFHLINLDEDYEIKSHRLNTWIISVIKSKVQELKIDVYGNDEVRLPNRLFTSNSLTSMNLSLGGTERWSITLPSDSSSMCLPNLLTLELHSVSFHDESLTNKFFLSCPNLKQLFMYDVELLNMNVNISALKLVILEVYNHGQNYGYCHWPNTKFNLHAPDLSSFTCQDFMSRDYIMGNLPSLVEANIDMKLEDQQHAAGSYSKLPVEKKQMYAQRMMQCLRALLYVKDLKLSAWFLEVISGSLDLLKGESIELCDLTCIRLKTLLSVDTIGAIAYLLKISPNMESLFLEISQIKFVSSNIGENLEAEVSMQCLLDKLKFVEIEGAVGCADELKFLESLLKNAKVLKKLVVYTSKVDSPNRQKRLTKFTKTLLTFPKASSDITILFF